MVAEQEVIRLQETKVRVESLLAYYHGVGEHKLAFVQDLELRLLRITAALRHAGE